MAYRVIWTQPAMEDADRAIGYTAIVFQSPVAMQEQLQSFYDAADSLTKMPLHHPAYEGRNLSSRGLRGMRIKRYILLYSVESDQVTVHRIIHKLQDYARHIR